MIYNFICLKDKQRQAGSTDDRDVACKLDIVNPPPEEFNFKAPALWARETEFVKGLFEKYMAEWEAIQDAVDETMEKKTKWNGAMSRIGSNRTLEDFNFFFGDLVLAERGAAACVLSCRRNKARKGPVPVALPGCVALYMPLGALWVIVYAVSVVLANGVAINDLPQFLETSSGKDLLANGSVVVMRVDPGECFYLPWGWLPTVFYLQCPSQCRPSEKLKGPDWTHCLSIPMVISEWLKAVEERTFTAIYTVLEDAYSPTAKQDLYREWAALLVSIKARE